MNENINKKVNDNLNTKKNLWVQYKALPFKVRMIFASFIMVSSFAALQLDDYFYEAHNKRMSEAATAEKLKAELSQKGLENVK